MGHTDAQDCSVRASWSRRSIVIAEQVQHTSSVGGWSCSRQSAAEPHGQQVTVRHVQQRSAASPTLSVYAI